MQKCKVVAEECEALYKICNTGGKEHVEEMKALIEALQRQNVAVETYIFRRYTALFAESELYRQWDWEIFIGRIQAQRPADADDDDAAAIDVSDPFMWQLAPSSEDMEKDVGSCPSKDQARLYMEYPAAVHSFLLSIRPPPTYTQGRAGRAGHLGLSSRIPCSDCRETTLSSPIRAFSTPRP